MALSDWLLEASEEAGYARAQKEEKEREHEKKIASDLARYMGV